MTSLNKPLLLSTTDCDAPSRARKRRKDTNNDDSDEDDTSDDDPIEDGEEPLRASSSARTIDEDDIELHSSDAEAERPRRNAPRSARVSLLLL